MYKWIAIAILVSVIGAFIWHENELSGARKEATADVVKEYSNDALEQSLEAIQTEKQIVEDALKAERKKNDAKQGIIDRNAALIRSLQHRPTREDSKEANPSTPEAGSPCTGAELHREDGEFLAREASRADEVIVDRDFYYERYEDARQQLERMNGQD